MTRRLQRQKEFLRILISIDKHWDFVTAGNDGVFTNKASLVTVSGRTLIMNRERLTKHIEWVKMSIRRELKGSR